MSSFSQPHNVKSYLLAKLIMEHPLVQHNKLWKQLFLIHKQVYNKLIIICYHNIYTVHCYHNIYTVHEIIMDEIVRVFHACIKDLHEHFRILLINSKEVSDVQRIKKIYTQTTMFNFCEKRVYIKIWCWLMTVIYLHGDDTSGDQFSVLADLEMPRPDSHEIIKGKLQDKSAFRNNLDQRIRFTSFPEIPCHSKHTFNAELFKL